MLVQPQVFVFNSKKESRKNKIVPSTTAGKDLVKLYDFFYVQARAGDQSGPFLASKARVATLILVLSC